MYVCGFWEKKLWKRIELICNVFDVYLFYIFVIVVILKYWYDFVIIRVYYIYLIYCLFGCLCFVLYYILDWKCK